MSESVEKDVGDLLTRGDRDQRGRFTKGNSIAVRGGNPRVIAVAALQRELAKCYTPKHAKDVLEAMRKQALAGDVGAASVWLSRVLGKERHLVALPDMRPVECAADVAHGVRTVLAAVTSGTLDMDSGERMLGLLRSAADALVVEQLEERIANLERLR